MSRVIAILVAVVVASSATPATSASTPNTDRCSSSTAIGKCGSAKNDGEKVTLKGVGTTVHSGSNGSSSSSSGGSSSQSDSNGFKSGGNGSGSGNSGSSSGRATGGGVVVPPPTFGVVDNGGAGLGIECYVSGRAITLAQYRYYGGCPDPEPGDSRKTGGPSRGSNQNATPAVRVTVSDIAQFSPTPGSNHMEPPGWMIVGLDTNFYAKATQHIKSGTLLGEPAEVRFTPRQYHWDYGDGSTRTTTTPGGTWEQLRKPEFDPTPGSHIYRAPGHYTITLSITFTAEWRWNGTRSWLPVDGDLRVPANDLEAIAVDGVKTVLVERTCIEDPTGPGCRTPN